MKLGIDAEEFITEWATEHSDKFILEFENIYYNDNLTNEERFKRIYTKTLTFVFAGMAATVNENNKAIEKQLRRIGIYPT